MGIKKNIYENFDSINENSSRLQNMMDQLKENLNMHEYAQHNNVSDEIMKTIDKKQKDILKNIDNLLATINMQDNMVQEQDKEIKERTERIRDQLKEMEYKKKLVATRNRQLELSQEKNVYKLKIIYIIVAIIILLICLLLAGYIIYKKY